MTHDQYHGLLFAIFITAAFIQPHKNSLRTFALLGFATAALINIILF